MLVIKTNTETQSNPLRKRVEKTRLGFTKLMESLSIKPCPFIGFGSPMPIERDAVLLGWSYDWGDGGDSPPPWSDWGDKSE